MSTADRSRRQRRQDVYTAGQLARLLGVSPRTVGLWIDSGQLPGWRVSSSGGGNGHRRAKRAVVEAFMRERGMPLSLLSDAAPVAE